MPGVAPLTPTLLTGSLYSPVALSVRRRVSARAAVFLAEACPVAPALAGVCDARPLAPSPGSASRSDGEEILLRLSCRGVRCASGSVALSLGTSVLLFGGVVCAVFGRVPGSCSSLWTHGLTPLAHSCRLPLARLLRRVAVAAVPVWSPLPFRGVLPS